MAKNGNFRLAIVSGHIGRSTGTCNTHPKQRHLVAKNGNFRLLLLQVKYRQINWQIYPPGSGIYWSRMAISDCYCYRSYRQIKWQINTHPKKRYLVTNNGNFRLLLLQVTQSDLTCRSTPQQRHLVAKNGNFRLLLLQVIQVDQLADVPPNRGIQWPRMTISDCYSYRSYRQIN